METCLSGLKIFCISFERVKKLLPCLSKTFYIKCRVVKIFSPPSPLQTGLQIFLTPSPLDHPPTAGLKMHNPLLMYVCMLMCPLFQCTPLLLMYICALLYLTFPMCHTFINVYLCLEMSQSSNLPQCH